ncbi:hypothetical protein BZA77DRAFT_357205 [Pyronema omphalodes]|nr:hypothetical protein BZA77DRAFT_357205 [Pyronema omphalodes]
MSAPCSSDSLKPALRGQFFTRKSRPTERANSGNGVKCTSTPSPNCYHTAQEKPCRIPSPSADSIGSDDSSLNDCDNDCDNDCIYTFGHLQLNRRVAFDFPQATKKEKARYLLSGKSSKKSYQKARSVVSRTASKIMASQLYQKIMHGYAPPTPGLLTDQISYYRQQIPHVEDEHYKIAVRAQEWCRSPLEKATHDILVRMQNDLDKHGPIFDSWLTAINEITIGVYNLRVQLDKLKCQPDMKRDLLTQLEVLFDELETLKANRNGGREWMALWNRKMSQCWLRERRELKSLEKMQMDKEEKVKEILKVEEVGLDD